MQALDIKFDGNAKAKVCTASIDTTQARSTTIVAINARPISFAEFPRAIQRTCKRYGNFAGIPIIVVDIAVEPAKIDILKDPRKEKLSLQKTTMDSFFEALHYHLNERNNPMSSKSTKQDNCQPRLLNMGQGATTSAPGLLSPPSPRARDKFPRMTKRKRAEDHVRSQRARRGLETSALNKVIYLSTYGVGATTDVHGLLRLETFSQYWGSYCDRRENVFETGDDYPQAEFNVRRGIQNLFSEEYSNSQVDPEALAELLIQNRYTISQRLSVYFLRGTILLPYRFAKDYLDSARAAELLVGIFNILSDCGTEGLHDRRHTDRLFENLYWPKGLGLLEVEKCRRMMSNMKADPDQGPPKPVIGSFCRRQSPDLER